MMCAIIGCRRRPVYRGVCETHRIIRLNSKGKTAEERFDIKIDKTGNCWLWLGGVNSKGYGFFSINGHHTYAHRHAYERAHGPIPAGMEVDHRCLVKRCVNPDHLRLATGAQNQQNRAGAQANSKTGYRNVYPRGDRFVAQVARKHLGTFDTAEEAAEVAHRARLIAYPFSEADHAVA